jgi:hypothetical protein
MSSAVDRTYCDHGPGLDVAVDADVASRSGVWQDGGEFAGLRGLPS